MNNNNIDITEMLNMLSKMDKSQLQASIQKANQIIKSNNKDEILKEINKNK